MANEQAKAFIDQATHSLQNSQFQQALELIDQAIAIEPGATDSHVLRGICLSQLGQPDAATDAFRKAIMLSPYNAKAYYNLAVHQNSLGNKKEASELAREAVGVDPRHAGARQLLSQLEQELSGVSGQNPDVIAPQEILSNPHDPLSAHVVNNQPLTSSGAQSTEENRSDSQVRPSEPPRPQTPTAPPSSNPYSGQTPSSSFTQQGFTRPGYEEPTSSLPWVRNMGAGWLVIGFVIAALPLINWIMSMGMISTIFNGSWRPSAETVQGTSAAMWAILILGAVLGLFWMICDILDRRSSWWWLIPFVVGICCCLNFIFMPLYIAAGRKRG